MEIEFGAEFGLKMKLSVSNLYGFKITLDTC